MIAVAPSMVRLLDADELDRILIHEWAHVQRRDDLVYIPQVAVRAIAGWHPALWWLDRRLHMEREIACDEMTVAIAGSPKSYAACLLKLATLRGRSHGMEAAPAALTSSYLRRRVSEIVTARKPIAPVWSRSLAAAIVTILGLMSMGLGGLALVATAFATPFVPRAASAQPNRLALTALPASSSSGMAHQSTGRPAGRSSFRRASAPEPAVAAPQPRNELAPQTTPEAASAVEPAPEATVAANAGPDITAPLPDAPLTAPVQSAVTADTTPSPWAEVKASGSAIGRKSKDAGVATAGLFTRFGKRVAGSF